MQTTPEIIDALKAKTGAPSDYALHKILGVTRQSISVYRTGGGSFSDEMCLKVASILEVDPAIILAIVYSERSKNEVAKAVWKGIIEKLGGVAASLLIATTLGGMTPTNANAGAASSDVKNSNSLYIMLNRRRTYKKVKTKIDLSFLVQNLLGFA